MDLSNRFTPLLDHPPTDSEEISKSINSCILATADKVTPLPKHTKPPWMKNDTITAIENKKTVRKDHGDTFKQYKSAKAVTKKLVKRDKLAKLENKHALRGLSTH